MMPFFSLSAPCLVTLTVQAVNGGLRLAWCDRGISLIFSSIFRRVMRPSGIQPSGWGLRMMKMPRRSSSRTPAPMWR